MDSNWYVTESLAHEHAQELERRTLRAERGLLVRRPRRPIWRRHAGA